MDVSNDREVERLGANATARYAMEYWQKLVNAARIDGIALDPVWGNHSSSESLSLCDATTQIKLLPLFGDQVRLYKRFLSNFGNHFPLLNTSSTALSDSTTNGAATGRWQSLLVASEGLVEDYNFMTLLRSGAHSVFWMNEQDVCEGVLVVPRAQFLFVEAARIHQGLYDGRFRRVVHLYDTKTQSDAIDSILHSRQQQQQDDDTNNNNNNNNNNNDNDDEQHERLLLEALHKLRTQWPYPRPYVLKQTGVVRVLKRGWKQGWNPAIRTACEELLRYWQDMIDLGKLSSSSSSSSFASLERAAKAMANQPTKLLSNNQDNGSPLSFSTNHTPPKAPSLLPAKTTSDIQDLTLSLSSNNNNNKKSTLATASTTSRVFETYGMVVLENAVSSDEIAACLVQSKEALQRLKTQHLEPRGLVLDGTNPFDFAQVRQRPGHRVDNRYGILEPSDSPIAQLGQRLLRLLPPLLQGSNNNNNTTTTMANNYKILYGGVVHSFPRLDPSDPMAPPPQLWHRDGPSLFDKTPYHETHCFNVFVPLIDVSVNNGATEFVPGTHDDQLFERHMMQALQNPSSVDNTVQAETTTGTVVVFDTRILHRGLSNASLHDRPLLYLTMSRTWFLEQHMFLQDDQQLTPPPDHVLMQHMYQLITNNHNKKQTNGQEATTTTTTATTTRSYHPHYTNRFDWLWMDIECQNDTMTGSSTTNKKKQNLVALVALANQPLDAIRQEVCSILHSAEAKKQKQEVLERASQQRRAQRKEQAEIYLHFQELDQEDDFASIETDLSDVAALYQLTARLLPLHGLSPDADGICLLLALLKATTTNEQQRALLEESFSSWWHAGVDRFHLTTATSTTRSPNVLVVFSSLGSGIARPEWAGSLRNVAPAPGLDVLQVLDPSFSWYCQDPTCQWRGGEYYAAELAQRLEAYDKVMFLGDSMGAAAALRFSQLVDQHGAILAFTPQLDISTYPAITRTDFAQETRTDFFNKTLQAVQQSQAKKIMIHYGSECKEDVRQIGFLPRNLDNLFLINHKFDDHVLSLHLREEGQLQSIVEEAIGEFLLL